MSVQSEDTPAGVPEAAAAARFLNELGVPDLPPRTVPFDPGYDPATVVSHLSQSSHLMAGLKLSMTCWQIAAPAATAAKISAAQAAGVPLVAGGATFEIAAQQRMLPAYFDLCTDLGIGCIEAGEGFTDLMATPEQVLALARAHGVEVQFELGRKTERAFTVSRVRELVEQGKHWLDAGAVRLVVEARENADEIGLFEAGGVLRRDLADQMVAGLGLETLCFEAPTKGSQFALLEHLGPDVMLSNVRLEELLRIEIYRRGMHADSYGDPRLGAWAPPPGVPGDPAPPP